MPSPARLLVVEDNAALLEAVQTALSVQYEVLAARRASEAFHLLAQQPVDLVLLDHALPGVSGLTFLWYLRTVYPSVPVVFMTGFGSEWLAVQVLRGGGRDYLRKPFSMGDLLGTVSRLVAVRQQRREARQPVLLAACPPAPADGRRAEPPLWRALAFAERNLAGRITLEDVAREAGMSRAQFVRLFKEALGCTFQSYLARLRVACAVELLRDPARSIADVAAAVGFKQEAHFSRVFRKVTGQSPAAFRRQLLCAVWAAPREARRAALPTLRLTSCHSGG